MLAKWIEESVPKVAQELLEINRENISENTISGFGMKKRVAMFIDRVRAALFPNVYDEAVTSSKRLPEVVERHLKEATILMNCIIGEIYFNTCERRYANPQHLECGECKRKAQKATLDFMSRLPEVARLLRTDIQAAYDGDPAALSTEEVLLSYPGFNATSIFRLAHILYEMDIPLLPRIMTELAHSETGIDIHPGATVGEYFFVDHGTGVVIGETTTIGHHVKIYQGVTLGAKSFQLDDNGNPVKGVKRHPNIEDYVVIYAGATILGGDTTVGAHSVIGGNVWLMTSVEPGSVVYNSTPSPIIK